VLQSYNDNNAIVSVIAGTEITLSFDEEGRIAGSAGVNSYFTSYEVSGNALTFGTIGTTMMAGPEDAMKQESTFLKLLSETTAFSGVGDELKLWDANGTVLLVFTKVVPPAPESLTGTTWILDSYNGGNGAIVSVITGTEISLSLNKDNEISGSAGCNTYFGSYETDGAALSFGMIGATLMFCDEPKGTMEQETAYLNLLEIAAYYGITGDQLVVEDAEGTVILTFTAAA
jgi:heat shock protein HslJ